MVCSTLFGEELAKVYRANKERASSCLFTPQLPLCLTPLSLTQAMVDLSGRVTPPTGEVAGIGIKVDPPLRQQLPNHPSLEAVRLP